MVRLARSLQAWNTAAFARTLKDELAGIGAGGLPLYAATSLGGRVDERALDVTLLGKGETATELDLRVGVFFVEIMGGCSCGDDPVESNAWCELRVRIDKATAAARIDLAHD